MDFPDSHNQLQQGSVKHTDFGVEHEEGSEGRLLGDGYQKLQHSNSDSELEVIEDLDLKTSSENVSTSVLRNGSYNCPHQRDVRPKLTSNKVPKIPPLEQKHTTKTHKPVFLDSKHSLKLAIPHQSSNRCNEYQYERSPSDPDYFSLLNKYDNFDLENGSHNLFKPRTEHLNDAASASMKPVDQRVSARQKENRFGKTRAHSMNRNESTKWHDSKGDTSPLSSSLRQSGITAEDGESNLPQYWRNSYVDFKTESIEPSSGLQGQCGESNSEDPHTNLISHQVTTGNLSQQASEVTPKHSAKYKTNKNKVENVSHQGAASSLPVRLNNPTITSTPHMRKPKSASDLEALRHSLEHRFEPENVKTKVKSVLNNIRFGWTFKSKSIFKYDSPLFMLGKCYHRRKDDTSTENLFLRDFVSRIWLTYRSNFYPIPGTKLSTDCGWGCMLRSGQMLIAQCLVAHFLGRDWRLYNKQTNADSAFYREIIRWFSDPLDTPSDKTPFCLHHLAHFGRAYNKHPGEWYGPASVAYIFRDAFIQASHTVPILSQLCLYVAQDCTVYIEDVLNLCTKKCRSASMSSSCESEVEGLNSSQKGQQEKWLRSLIILIPMRLGGEVTNEIYAPCVQSFLSHDNCMGIIGGRPKHSLYFLGWQDSKLIYLDPHLCREAVDTTVSDFKIETFHCMTPRKLAISKMDPSCTVGFYVRDADDFNKFVHEVREFISPPKQKGIYPLFTFSDGCQLESTASPFENTRDRRVRVTHYQVDQYGRKTVSGESEDFVVL